MVFAFMVCNRRRYDVGKPRVPMEMIWCVLEVLDYAPLWNLSGWRDGHWIWG